MTRETGRERYWRQVREIQEEHDVDTREARRMWSLYFKRGGKKRKRIALAVRSTLSDASLCPFCRDDIVTEDALSCDQCRTTYHSECLEEFGSVCPTLGCTTRRGLGSIRIRAHMVEASRERRQQLLIRSFWFAIGLIIFFVLLNVWSHG